MNDDASAVSGWIRALKGFTDWDALGGSATQTSSRAAEDFFQAATERAFPEAWVRKLTSQERMDFAIGPKRLAASILEWIKKKGSRNPTEFRLKQWESSAENKSGTRFVFVQVKTGGGTFTLNDTFPPPDEDLVYAFFDYDGGIVNVTTSAHMAKSWNTNPTIKERYKLSVKAEEEFGETLRAIWKDTPVGTAARPTYRIGREYASSEPDPSVLMVLLRGASAL